MRLWDGRDYCARCIEDACPGMAGLAGTHPRLEETTPVATPPTWAQRTLDLVVLALATLLVAAGTSVLGALLSVVLPLGLAALAAAACAGYCWYGLLQQTAAAKRKWLLRNRPTIAVRDGVLSVMRSGRTGAEAPLASCSWCTGDVSRDDGLRAAYRLPRPLRRARVVLIAVPSELGAGYPHVAACGWTDETRALWAAFLALAGVPHSPP